MTTPPRVRLSVLRVGSCRHPERMTLRGGSWRAVEFPALVGVVRHPVHGVLLFDTGYAERFLDATRGLPERLYRWTAPMTLPARETLRAQLARLGIAPEDVRGVMLSHLHADHLAGLRDLPDAEVWCSSGALRHARGLGRAGALRKAFLRALLPDDLDDRLRPIEARPRRTLPGRWAALGEGHDLLGDASLWAVPLPGHARGHMGLLLRNEDEREVLLAGDAAWSTRGLSSGRLPAWPVRLLIDDWAAYRATLATLGALAREHADLCVLPSHCLDAWRALPEGMRVEA